MFSFKSRFKFSCLRFCKYTHRQKKRLIMISLINDLEIIFVLIFLYYC
jgi:hypothetical protein